MSHVLSNYVLQVSTYGIGYRILPRLIRLSQNINFSSDTSYDFISFRRKYRKCRYFFSSSSLKISNHYAFFDDISAYESKILFQYNLYYYCIRSYSFIRPILRFYEASVPPIYNKKVFALVNKYFTLFYAIYSLCLKYDVKYALQ